MTDRDKNLVLNDRVRIAENYHWAQGQMGTIVEAPRQVRNLSPGWANTFTRIQVIPDGETVFHWVRFDGAQVDPDGDSPYMEAEIDEAFINVV